MLTFILGMTQFKILYHLIPETPYHSSVVWFLNFALGTFWVHALHRYVTFKGVKHVSYFTSLIRTYISYASVLLFGFLMMLFLCDFGGLHHMIGWGFTNAAMSVFNFQFMRSFSILSWEGS